MLHKQSSVFLLTLIFAVVTLGSVAAFLYWNTQQRISDFTQNQYQLMEGATTSTTNELSFLVTDLQRRVQLFADEHLDNILALVEDSFAEHPYLDIDESIKRRFPNSFAFTIANAQGSPLIDDFEGFVGAVCQADIVTFAKRVAADPDNHKKEVYVHPNPLGYHFDIMAQWADPDDDKNRGVFFVSFLLEDISRSLSNGALPGHQLILTKVDTPNLIEVTSEGGRNQLSRAIRLTDEELARVLVKKEVPNSLWLLVDLPPAELFSDQLQQYQQEALMVMSILSAVVLIMLLFLLRVQAQLDQSRGQLLQSEKMASLGQMIAGLAHEVNTPLAYIRSNLALVSDKLELFDELINSAYKINVRGEANDETKKFFNETVAELNDVKLVSELAAVTKESIAGLDEIKGLVADLKDFSRVDRKLEDNVLIEKSIEHALNIAKHQLAGIKIHREFGETPAVRAAPSQLNQVFLNLMANAIQAVDPDDGEITLRTSVKGRYIVAEIEDNGHGIPKQLQKKIFDPFFTTKEVGEGTGLGLSIVFKIIRDHGGDIELHSREGVGSRFTVSLPLNIKRRNF